MAYSRPASLMIRDMDNVEGKMHHVAAQLAQLAVAAYL
jgi:hypothetical protein